MSAVTVSKTSPASKPSSTAPAPWRPFDMIDPVRFANLSPFPSIRQFLEAMGPLYSNGLETKLTGWAPAVDIERCNGSLVVSAELPGMKKDDVKVEISDDAIVLEGERKQEHKEDHDGYHRYERSYGKFYRSIPMPEGAQADKAKAEMKDGVLRVTMPVAEAEKPKTRRIPVAA